MPTSALISATIEKAINLALDLDSQSAKRMRPLSGMRLYLFIDPLPHGLCLVFSEHVDVLTVFDNKETVKAQLSDKCCCIHTSISTLPTLTDTNQLTRLIQQKQLEVDGALTVAQHVSGLFQQLDIDVEEIIAQKTGDVFAHTVVSASTSLFNSVKHTAGKLGRVAGNAIVEEKQLAAHRLAVMHFSDTVNTLRDDTARLEARLNTLEESSKK